MVKKSLFLATLALFVLGLSTTASSLEPWQNPAPGCNSDIFKAMANRADAVRARNRAYAREVISRNDSILYLTCYDQAMRLSTRLGYIFSDNMMPNPPVQNTVVFGPQALSYRDWGTRRSMATDMHYMAWLTSLFGNYVGANFSAYFGRSTSPVENALRDFAQELWGQPAGLPATGPIDKIVAFHENPANKADLVQVRALYVKIYNLIRDLPTSTTQAADVTEIEKTVKELAALKKSIEAERLKVLKPLLDDIKAKVMGGETALTQACIRRLRDSWTVGNVAAGLMPVEGAYIVGSPYYSLDAILEGSSIAATSSPTFHKELSVNGSVLGAAWNDLAGPNGVLKPGSSVWPSIPANMPLTAAGVILQMEAGP